MGDSFTSRVPATIQQDVSRTTTEADAYISDYNIYMGKLRNGGTVNSCFRWHEVDLSLGLRDELEIELRRCR